MTDTIESLRAERDAVIADFSRELDEARKQITESVMEWARKSGCVYCGEVFDTLGPEGERESRRALYTAHTKVCAGHPMRDVEVRAEKAEAERDQLNATLGALTAWTHEYGAALKPPGADTYGEGKRDAKNEVSAILREEAMKHPDGVTRVLEEIEMDLRKGNIDFKQADAARAAALAVSYRLAPKMDAALAVNAELRAALEIIASSNTRRLGESRRAIEFARALLARTDLARTDLDALIKKGGE